MIPPAAAVTAGGAQNLFTGAGVLLLDFLSSSDLTGLLQNNPDNPERSENGQNAGQNRAENI